MRWAWLLVISGCSATIPSNDAISPDGQPAYCASAVPSTACSVEHVTGTVPGIAISIRADACVVRQGCAATFAFDIEITEPPPSLTYAAEPNGCTRRPHPYTTDPRSLVSAYVRGVDQSWCRECDFECSPAEGGLTLQPAPGTYPDIVEWSGHEGSPQYPPRDPFVPGDYSVGIVVDGGAAGLMRVDLPFQVVL